MNHTKFILSLALVMVLSPAATDMYLASMPKIAAHFYVSYALVQMSLTMFLFAQGGGQLLFGPVIDKFGRRRPLLIGIVVFLLSSVWAGCSMSIHSLIISRFIQGLSGSLLLVTGFSSVRDVADGAPAARMFAILFTIEGLTPIFAPILGGFIDTHLGWRAVLFASAVMAVLAFINSYKNLGETLPPEERLPLQPAAIARTYISILMDKKFLLPALALSMVFFYLFAYIGGASYLYQEVFHLSANGFGLVFGISGGAVLVGAAASGKMVKKHSVGKITIGGVICIIAGTAVAFMLSFGLYGVIAGFTLALFGIGIVEPALVAITMSSQKTALGFTAALMGAMHLMLSSFSSPISGILLPLSTAYWFIFLLVSAVVSLGIVWMAKKCS